jgi:hypothetical protein
MHCTEIRIKIKIKIKIKNGRRQQKSEMHPNKGRVLTDCCRILE